MPDRCSIDCSGQERLDWAPTRSLLALPSETQVAFRNGTQALYEALALLGDSPSWNFDGGFRAARVPVSLHQATQADEWIIRLAPEAEWVGWMRDDESVQWVGHLQAGRIWVDIGSIDSLRSVIIGWLLAIRQLADPAPLFLCKVNQRALNVLRQMRLGSVFVLPGRDGLEDPSEGSSSLRSPTDVGA